MGLLARLRGTDRPPAVKQAVSDLESRLPRGWRFVEFRQQLFCRRPVKLVAYGATVEGPDGRRLLTVSTGDDHGVSAVRALLDAVEGRATTSAGWAPPPIRPPQTAAEPPRGSEREAWPLVAPGTDEEASARAEALALLPLGAAPTNVDAEKFGDVEVYAVVAQLPDGLGIAGAGLSPAQAWRALADRHQGSLLESAVWHPRVGG